MSLLIQVLVAISCAVIMVYSVLAINKMSLKTNHVMRAAYILMATGSFGELAHIFVKDHLPSIEEALFILGVGIFIVAERRILRCPVYDCPLINCPHPQPVLHENENSNAEVPRQV